jgi:hypothetical protein
MFIRILSYFWVRNNVERFGVALILALSLV